MDHFVYRDGELTCEAVNLAALAAEVGTPCYVYSRATILTHYDKLAAAFAPLRPMICFSVKSCSNIHVLRALVERGAGLDVVSGGELARARLAGCPPERIVFAGVGKTDEEIRDALSGAEGAGPIGLFNVESEPEFEVVAAAARAMNVSAKAALRINPEVSAGGHDYIQTARKESKFGVTFDHARALITRFAREKHLKLTGLHLHIGSSINTPGPYVDALRKTLTLVDALAAEGVQIDTLDLGGGFGADYHTGDAPPAADYARELVPLLLDRVARGLRIVFEPGRTIVASAGVLLTRVLYVKHAAARKFIVCDAGMQTLIRPALYNAFHFIWPTSVSPHHEPPTRSETLDLPGLERADVVGPVCESGDFLAKDRLLPPVARGELLAVFTAGAYGMSMASRYNSHPLPCEVMVDGARARIIRQRERHADLVHHELSPSEVAL
ncbi:MAG: diaminopimelate decarboxylase [Phycisphaerales bacterium]